MPPLGKNYIAPDPSMVKSFGRLVRKRRRELDLSQRDLAEALGFTQSRLCHIENGHGVPSFAPLMRLMVILRINPLEVMPHV